jgi:hypothetical protein
LKRNISAQKYYIEEVATEWAECLIYGLSGCQKCLRGMNFNANPAEFASKASPQ